MCFVFRWLTKFIARNVGTMHKFCYFYLKKHVINPKINVLAFISFILDQYKKNVNGTIF